ncbi:hypothetical protein B0T10DRAFT_310639 [Thelonectria olida]|uniref:Uncharacterized protein n=1 Tax=Thelonectria olida TaxID=1576542 RepID=A0A9P9AR40_9HYPO|nr:hypothetical protein B0T10DRAFT_310639 [Thelonectria olida]
MCMLVIIPLFLPVFDAPFFNATLHLALHGTKIPGLLHSFSLPLPFLNAIRVPLTLAFVLPLFLFPIPLALNPHTLILLSSLLACLVPTPSLLDFACLNRLQFSFLTNTLSLLRFYQDALSIDST